MHSAFEPGFRPDPTSQSPSPTPATASPAPHRRPRQYPHRGQRRPRRPLVRLAELGVGERVLLLQPTPRLRLRTTDLAHLRPGHITTHAPLTCRAPGRASAAPRGGLDTNR